jgi:hypothetical protein
LALTHPSIVSFHAAGCLDRGAAPSSAGRPTSGARGLAARACDAQITAGASNVRGLLQRRSGRFQRGPTGLLRRATRRLLAGRARRMIEVPNDPIAADVLKCQGRGAASKFAEIVAVRRLDPRSRRRGRKDRGHPVAASCRTQAGCSAR